MKFKILFLNLFLIVTCFELTQVLILSRHNIRSPLVTSLEEYSPYPWPKWSVNSGYLTEKGALIEEYMGDYMSNWLFNELFKENCPEESSLKILSNSTQRTYESSNAFIRGAFKNCNKLIRMETEEMDTIFEIVVRNDSKVVEEHVVNEMKIKINELDTTESYNLLENVLDLKNADVCTIRGKCHFDKADNKIVYEIGNLPNVVGSLIWTHLIVDTFLMSYYDGFPMEDVAWGKIKNKEQWITLTRVLRQYPYVVFKSKLLGRQVSKPLLSYILYMVTRETAKKFILLHCHDANLYALMAALEVKDFLLPEQYESAPIGGKLVFQRWYDATQDRDLFKLDYVYLSVEQIRDGLKLSTNNPPRRTQLFIKDCHVDSDGFCSWEEFLQVLNDAVSS